MEGDIMAKPMLRTFLKLEVEILLSLQIIIRLHFLTGLILPYSPATYKAFKGVVECLDYLLHNFCGRIELPSRTRYFSEDKMGVALSLVVAYLLGSIPFAYLIGRLKGMDIRAVGDRNVGAFNVFRHIELTAGVSTLAADIGKGVLAIVVAKALSGEVMVAFLAGGAVVAGHNWPVFLRFRGGRGAGAAIGVLLVLLPREMSISLVLAAMSLLVTRNSIWCGVMLFVPTPLFGLLFAEPPALVVYSMALPCLLGLTHWLTVRRLPPEAQKEAEMFWVGPGVGHKRKGSVH